MVLIVLKYSVLDGDGTFVLTGATNRNFTY